MRRAALVLLVLLPGAAGPEAHAQDTTARLSFEAPPSCPPRASFVDAVVGRVGRNPFDEPDTGAPAVIIEIAETERGYLGEVRWAGEPTAPRPLRAERCEDVLTAAALVVALRFERAPSPTTTRVVVRVIERDPEVPPDLAPPPPPPAGPSVHLEGAATVESFVGLTPLPTVGGAVGLALRYDALSVLVEGRIASTPVDVTLRGQPVGVLLGVATIEACGGFAYLRACGGIWLGGLSARGGELSERPFDAAFFASLDARVGARLPIEEVGITLHADVHLAIPITRASIVLDGATAWVAEPVGAGLGLGVSTLFF